MNRESILRRVAPLLTALAAVFAAACDSSVKSNDDSGPDDIDNCAGPDDSCCEGEFVGDCANGVECSAGEWRCIDEPLTTSGTGGSGSSTSTGEPETCPEMQPAPGTSCSTEGLECEVTSGMDCGPPTVTITCVDGAWVSLIARCGTPLCRGYADAGSCEASGCRWQEPGCGDTPLLEAGCFDQVDCTSSDQCFASDERCTTVSVLPACATEEPLCDSCGMDVQLCVPMLVGEPDNG